MQVRNWIRIVLCGLIAGVVWYALSSLFLAFFAQDFLAVAEEGSYARWSSGVFFGMDLMMGVWAVWLYSAIAPRYGAGLKTAAITGFAWWIIKSLQSAKWVGLGFAPQGVILVPLATTLIAIMAASAVGAWFFQKTETPAAE